jgi:hypothetical protein
MVLSFNGNSIIYRLGLKFCVRRYIHVDLHKCMLMIPELDANDTKLPNQNSAIH